jgi:hypothetical protein
MWCSSVGEVSGLTFNRGRWLHQTDTSGLRLTFLDGQILFLKAHMDRSIDPRFDANVTAASEHLN